jgi:lipid II:glycine glycyltransferase (peptidoglycan interpeptide bridge formation enzyme)
LTHDLDLSQTEQEIFTTFKDSTKRNIIKAIQKGVHVKIQKSLESIEEYYRLHCITRKRHGLPPQPLYFFKKIYEHIISKKKGFVALATYKKKVIAGAVFFQFGHKAIFKYGASDPRYLYLRPNNLVMWEAIKRYCQNGFKIFNFGRTELKHKGLLQFKRGWGVKEEILNYYKYDLKENCFVIKKVGIKSSYRFFKVMPAPILRFAGNILYRHVG